MARSKKVMRFSRPHAEQRTNTVRKSGPMSMPVRLFDRQCGQ